MVLTSGVAAPPHCSTIRTPHRRPYGLRDNPDIDLRSRFRRRLFCVAAGHERRCHRRRSTMRNITVAALASAAILFAGTAVAQQNVDFSKVEIKTTDLGNKTYLLQGQGGNITVAVGTDGIIMVDSEFAPLHDKIKAAIE